MNDVAHESAGRQFSAGRDLDLVFLIAGVAADIGLITFFEARRVYPGWCGQLGVVRQNAVLETLAETQDHQLGAEPLTDVRILTTIREADGSRSTADYLNCIMRLQDAGQWSPEGIVNQVFSFVANNRVWRSASLL